MRYSILTAILLLMLNAPIFAQHLSSDTKYVWAPSGLTLRAGPCVNAAKISVVARGAMVKVLERMWDGEELRIKLVDAFAGRGGEVSKQLTLVDRFVRVGVDGREGYLYNGYLSNYPAPAASEDFYAWLKRIGGNGEPFTAQDADNESYSTGKALVIGYDWGIQTITRQYESGGSTTYFFPIGDLNEGILITTLLQNVPEWLQKTRTGELTDREDYMETHLTEATDKYLRFETMMSTLEVSVVGQSVVIVSSGGC